MGIGYPERPGLFLSYCGQEFKNKNPETKVFLEAGFHVFLQISEHFPTNQGTLSCKIEIINYKYRIIFPIFCE